MSIYIGLIGLFVAIILLVILAMKGVPILLIGLVCSSVVALTSGLNIYDVLKENYMTGYMTFLGRNLLIFLAGAMFGRMMEITGAANSIADFIVTKLGKSKGVLAIVLACCVLCYGGVSVYVVAFTIYPIAVSIFRDADIPRYFLPGAIGFGSVTFAMTSPGTPQLQNILPTQSLGTDTMAGAVVGFIVGIVMLIIGYFWLSKMIKKAIAGGAHFEASEADRASMLQVTGLPNIIISLIPIVITIVVMNVLKVPAEVSITISVAIGLLLMRTFYDYHQLLNDFTKSASGAISAATNTCAVVAFGSVVKIVPAFQSMIDWVTSLPLEPLLGCAIAVTVMCSICGSASGGLGISVPIVGPIYMALGVPAAAIHRVASIASGALDSMPHNGYIVTLLNVCGCTHKEGYMPLFWLTVVVPTGGTLLAVLLFKIFPFLP